MKTTSQQGIDLIKKYESFRAKPYLCPAGIPTIGYGTTTYPNGVRVRLSDPRITKQKADAYLKANLKVFEGDVDFLTKSVKLKQNQFDALVSFAYNVGSDIDMDTKPEGLGDSTLLKILLRNPSDPRIEIEFKKWIYSGGRKLNGLVKRRKDEAKLYFS